MDQRTERRSRALLAMLVLSLAAATTATAVAIDVRGTLRVPNEFGQPAAEPDAEGRRNHYWDEWNGFLEPRSRGFDAARDLAVVLTGEGTPAEEQPGFRLANGGLWPTTLVARAGARIELRNADSVSHQVIAEGLEEFGDTPIAPGRMRPIDIATAGSWPLRDRLYEHVHGHLHVIADLIARATIESDGQYHFVNVPPGTYTLKVFLGSEMIHSREGVVVEERELTLEPIQLGVPQ